MRRILILLVCILVILWSCESDDITIEDFKSVEIGTKQEAVHERFGRPDGTLSGMYGDMYTIDDKNVIFYYEPNKEKGFPVTEVIVSE